MKELELGNLVLLTLDSPGKVGVTQGMLKYRGWKFRISRIKKLKLGTYYELGGCESKYGVPYTITRDWVRPMVETDDLCTYGRRRR